MTVRDGTVQRVLIFMSGADPTNETAKVLQAVRHIGRGEIEYDVVVGGSNWHAEELVERFGDAANIVFHRQVNNMARLMAMADLAIGGGGTTTWERCFLGLPTLTMIMADNQARMTQLFNSLYNPSASGPTTPLGYASPIGWGAEYNAPAA